MTLIEKNGRITFRNLLRSKHRAEHNPEFTFGILKCLCEEKHVNTYYIMNYHGDITPSNCIYIYGI